ncbi:hypothetical protein [Burkholderia thailandensis]|nr:hypothetical protein [Burkholderia thailandensis]MCZ2897622.1 hypothetical protein [Burkholderia thailandensis]
MYISASCADDRERRSAPRGLSCDQVRGRRGAAIDVRQRIARDESRVGDAALPPFRAAGRGGGAANARAIGTIGAARHAASGPPPPAASALARGLDVRQFARATLFVDSNPQGPRPIERRNGESGHAAARLPVVRGPPGEHAAPAPMPVRGARHPEQAMTTPASPRRPATGDAPAQCFLNPYRHGFVRIAVAIPPVRVAHDRRRARRGARAWLADLATVPETFDDDRAPTPH